MKLTKTLKTIFFAFIISISTSALAHSAKQLETSIQELVPDNYVVQTKFYGDLNQDNQEDVVLIIKGTDKSQFFTDEYLGLQDLNRRGIIVAFKDNNQYKKILENNSCFNSEDENPGAYYPPELDINIENQKLYVIFRHGRYGWWQYTFQHKDSDFELIGYDASSDRGPYVERVTNINFLTKKRVDKINTAPDEEVDPIFNEEWTNLTLEKTLKLSEIEDFTYVKALW